MKSKCCYLSFALLISLLMAVSTLHAEVTATASLNVQSFPMDRVAQLSITVQGVRSFQPQIPEVDGLHFHQRGQSTQVEIVNGAYSSSVTSMYLVEASHSGTFTIPPITIDSKQGDVETAAITFEVTEAQQSSMPQSSGPGALSTTRLRSGEADEVAFMRVVPAKQSSYSGEVVPVQIRVYFRDGIKANLNSLPQLTGEGFVLQQLAREPQQTREVVNNSAYSVLTWDSTLSGIKEGQHTLSVELDATLFLRQQRNKVRRPRTMFSDPFFGDSFFDDFFGSYQEKEVKVASPKLEMTVLALPGEGRPDNFTGAIGDFQLQVNAEPLDISQGDPVTLTMTVGGRGNFDRVQAPQLDSGEGWKTYSPSSEFLQDGSDNRGKKVFEQALVAKDSRLQEIPLVSFSYFDPEGGNYKTLVSAPIPLKVRSEAGVKNEEKSVKREALEVEESPLETAPGQVQPAIPGLAPQQLHPGDMEQKLEPLFTQRWFQLLCLAVLLMIGLAATLKIRSERRSNNPGLQRQQAMKHLLLQREKEIAERLAAQDSRGFLAACRSAIQEQLGLLWDMEAAAITLADLQKRLPLDSVLSAIFSAADKSAYGGQELSSEQMQEFISGLKNELESLL